MIRSFKNTRTSLVIAFIASLGFMAEAFAIAPIAMVSAVKGNAFIHHLGRTRKVKVGDQIHNFSEIFTEMGSQISFSDYYDHQYHLSGSGHLKLNGKTVELKGGYLWLQSFNREESFSVVTSNAHINYLYGESVISFDTFNGKSQLMTISGTWDLSNKFEKFRTVRLQDGQFSFISKDYENGSPRQPTPIGQSSYKRVVSLFTGVKSLGRQASREFQLTANAPVKTNYKTTKTGVSRGVASQVEGDQFPARTDSRALIRAIAAGGETKSVTNYSQTSVSEKDAFLRYYKSRVSKMRPKKRKKSRKIDYAKKSTAKVYIFGANWKTPINKKVGDIRIIDPKRFKELNKVVQKPAVIAKVRAPASVPKPAKVEAPKNIFESTLRREYKKQTRHSNEVNDLINELESYDQDYQRSY